MANLQPTLRSQRPSSAQTHIIPILSATLSISSGFLSVSLNDITSTFKTNHTLDQNSLLIFDSSLISLLRSGHISHPCSSLVLLLLANDLNSPLSSLPSTIRSFSLPPLLTSHSHSLTSLKTHNHSLYQNSTTSKFFSSTG